jgi:hypothetical protein
LRLIASDRASAQRLSGGVWSSPDFCDMDSSSLLVHRLITTVSGLWPLPRSVSSVHSLLPQRSSWWLSFRPARRTDVAGWFATGQNSTWFDQMTEATRVTNRCNDPGSGFGSAAQFTSPGSTWPSLLYQT